MASSKRPLLLISIEKEGFFDDMFGFDDFNNLSKDPVPIVLLPWKRRWMRVSKRCVR
jgi:hypothetical protein